MYTYRCSTNKITRINHPTKAIGKIYKGPENYYMTPKDALGDGLAQNFNNPNINGRSYDTVYLIVKYWVLDESTGKLVEKESPEFWYPFMKPPVGTGEYFEFYIADADGTGYFTLRLHELSRSPKREGVSENHGKWYIDIQIDTLEIIGYTLGPVPPMNPPAKPSYTPINKI